MADASNPWSAEGWNLTAQAAYLKLNGQARAEARARDAGTTLGGKRPGGTGTATGRGNRVRGNDAGGTVTADDGTIVKYVILKKFYVPDGLLAPPSLSVVASVQPALGVNMVAKLYREYDIPNTAPALGFATLATVTLELDIVKNAVQQMGFSTAAALTLERQIAAAPALGIAMAASIFTQFVGASVIAAPALGLAMAAALDLELNINTGSAAALGATMAASLTRELPLGISVSNSPLLGLSMSAVLDTGSTIFITGAPALGVTMGALLSVESHLAAASALGISTAVILSASSPPMTGSFDAPSKTASGVFSSGGTFTGCNFGTADPNRWLIAVVTAGTNDVTFTGCTIGGVAATKVCAHEGSVGTVPRGAMWIAHVPTGTSGSVAISTSGGVESNLGVAVYSVISPAGTLTINANNQGVGGSATVGVVSGGLVVACALSNSGGDTFSATNCTLDGNFGASNGQGQFAYRQITASDTSPQTVSVSNVGGHTQSILAGSFGP